MGIQDEISSAITAHGEWKVKLRMAINSGQCETTPDKVKMDNNCSFGKWLHQRILPEDKGAYYSSVVDLHAKFHKEAGKILEIALNGGKEQATSLMDPGGEFRTLTDDLTNELRRWQHSL